MRTLLVVLAAAGAMAFATPALADHDRSFGYPAAYQAAYGPGCAGPGYANTSRYAYNFPNYWGAFPGNRGLHRGHAYGHSRWSFWPFRHRADRDNRARFGAYNGWGYGSPWYRSPQVRYPSYGDWNHWNRRNHDKYTKHDRKYRHHDKDQGKNHNGNRHGD